ncbi:hypothetical protein Golob_023072, partial [Gossypium lobatum]|nr:hypothetical protein [Gossypium lobatum]
WNHSASYFGIPTALEDIRLLLNQRLEAHDPTIRPVIPDEFQQNLKIWHVRVLLVNYAIIEMHQTNRMLRQFGFRKSILVAPEGQPINSAHAITEPNASSDDAHTTTTSDYAKCIS